MSESTKCELDRKNSMRCRGTECPGQWHKTVCPRKASQGYLNRKSKHGRSKIRKFRNNKPGEKTHTHKGKERKNAVQRPCHVESQRKCSLNIRNPPEVRHGPTHRRLQRLQRLQVFIAHGSTKKATWAGT